MAGRQSARRPSHNGLGQHFLAGAPLAARIVADAGIDATHVVAEFGAGTGVLTTALARTGATVLAVEVDPVLVAGLRGRVADHPNVVVFQCDALDFELPCSPFHVVANPPFGATSALLHQLLDDPCGGLVRADLVVQWQVARARAAVNGTASTADLNGTCWAPWWSFRRARRIPAQLFRPVPSVDAAILSVSRRERALLPPEQAPDFAAFVRERFGCSASVTVDEWVRRFSRDSARARRRARPSPAARRDHARRAR